MQQVLGRDFYPNHANEIHIYVRVDVWYQQSIFYAYPIENGMVGMDELFILIQLQTVVTCFNLHKFKTFFMTRWKFMVRKESRSLKDDGERSNLPLVRLKVNASTILFYFDCFFCSAVALYLLSMLLRLIDWLIDWCLTLYLGYFSRL